MPAPGDNFSTDDVMAALYASGAAAPGQANMTPVNPYGAAPPPVPAPAGGPPTGAGPVDPYATLAITGQGGPPGQPTPGITPDTGRMLANSLTGTPQPPGAPGGGTGAPGPRKPLNAEDAADQDVTNAFGATAKSADQAAVLKNQAERDRLNAQADAMVQGNTKIAADDTAYYKARMANEAAADLETKQWMQDLDKKSKEEPNPHRWWDNTSSFGKAMWLASLAFSTMGQAKVGGKNIAGEMMSSEIDADIARQKDSLTRQIDAMKLKGQEIDKTSARKLADLQDVHAARVTRLMSLQQAMVLRAGAPGSTDDKAAVANANAELGKLAISEAQKKRELISGERQKTLDRQHEDYRAANTINAENNRQTNSIGAENERHTEDRIDKYNLAGIKFGEKLEGAGADKEHKDYIPLSPAAQIYRLDANGNKVLDESGQPEPVRIHKDAFKDVGPEAVNATALANGLHGLRDQMADSTTRGRLLKNDVALNSAVKSVLDPQIKAMGLRPGAETYKNVSEQILGEDYDSFMSRLKSNPDDVVQVLDQKIRDLPGDIQHKLAVVSDLREGESIGFGLPDTTGKKPTAPSPEDEQQRATGKAPAQLHLSGPDDFTGAAKYGDQIKDQLPTDLHKTVVEALGHFEAQNPSAVVGDAEAGAIESIKKSKADDKEKGDAIALVRQRADVARHVQESHESALKGYMSAEALRRSQSPFSPSTGKPEFSLPNTEDARRDLAARFELGGMTDAQLKELVDEVNTSLRN